LKETVKHVIDVRWHEIAEAEEPAIVFYINAGLLTNEEEPKSGYQIMQIHAEPDISHLMGTRLSKFIPEMKRKRILQNGYLSTRAAGF
jgi:hypothetical protein